MKTFNKVVAMFLVMVLAFVGTSFSNAATAPTFTPDIASGSTVAPGDKITMVIEVADDNAYGIQECTYSWNGEEEKSIFDTTKLQGKEGEYGKITFTFEDFSDTPGVNTLKISAKDDLGNSSGIKTFKYTVVDDEKPTITSNVANKSTVKAGSSVSVEVKDNDVLKKIVYSWNDEEEKTLDLSGEAYYKYTYKMEKFPNVNATFELNISAEDVSGNVIEKTFVYYVKYDDTTAPVVSMSKPDGSVLAGGTKLTLTVTDSESKIETLKYNWEGSSVKDIIPSQKEPANKCTVTNLTIGSVAGTYRFHVTAINSVGKKTTATYTYIVKAQDTNLPNVDANPASGKILPKRTITLTATDKEELATLKYNWDNGTSKTETVSGTEDEVKVIAPSIAGEHTLYVTVTDVAGNSMNANFTYTILETEVPTVTANPASGEIEANSIIEVTARDNEALKTLTYKWDNGSATTKTISGTKATIGVTAPATKGEHVLRVTVFDQTGNSQTEEFTYTIGDTEKPTVQVSPNGGNVDAGDPVKITGKDNEGLDNITYNWDDEDPVKKPVSGKEATVNTEVPTTPGKHTLYVTVEDEDGNKETESFDFIVSDDEDPTITMNPKSGSTVKGGKVVKATLKDNVELKKVTYNWEGKAEQTETLDGTSETISLPALPNKEGTYKVNITVEDNAGNVTSGKYVYYVEDEDDDKDEEEPTVDADPDGGEVEFGDKITITAEDEDGEIEYVEYYWDDDDDDTTKKYKDEFTVKVPSEEGKHYLYVRAMDDDDNLCDYERFTYYVEENNYPGNSDIIGDVNNKVRALRVEIRNADDKIRFEPEEEILYYVDYYNGTSSDVKNVKLVVDLPTYLEGEEASDDGDVAKTKVTWSLGTLEAGEYGRVSFIAKYTSSKANEKIITVPAKIYSGSSLKDTSTVRNMIFCVGASGSGSHQAYCVGYPDGGFRAEGKITRAELASMIANIEGITSTYRGQFIDVNNHWAANYIQAVVDRGYMLPKGYNTFGAQQYATRADLAYAIAVILDVHDLEPIFISATDTENSNVRCAMEQLLRLGIMDGYSDGSAKPNSNITRAEAVTIINNYLFRGELYTKGYNYSYNFENNYAHGGNYYILRFTDLSSNHWAYGHIMEATNNHRYERIMDGNEEMI